MARKRKVDNAILKRIQQAKQREERVVEERKEREYFLLFCEGSRTEPNYFNSFKNTLPNHLVKLEVDPTGGLNTISLVEHAIKTIPKYKTINSYIEYQIWIIFDKDSFPETNFNAAVTKAENCGFNCAYSNEAFELWYLLHFEYYDTGISRSRYKGLLTKHLGKKYKKNDKEIFQQLQSLENSSEELAIRSAKRLERVHLTKTPSNSNPITMVYKLIEKLNEFRSKDKEKSEPK